MRSKHVIILILLGAVLIAAFTGFAAWNFIEGTTAFPSGGYVLRAPQDDGQALSFRQGERYSVTLSGQISFASAEEGKVTIPRESFAHLDNSSTMALSDGVLLDLNDLSENFINNYYIPQGLAISSSDSGYSAQTTAGDIQFGEHVWKLTDSMYLIRSSGLSVHFSSTESYNAGQYVQIYVTADRVVYIQSAEGQWMTISPDCYIRTARGVKIYPLSLLVDNGTYKLSLAKLAVSTEDAIVLTELETRRQIVPELKIEAIDGDDGEDGNSGKSGSEGTGGANGEDGDNGKNGGIGTSGSNAVSDTSTNSALPTMTITNWVLNGERLDGTLSVKNTKFLSELSGVTDYMTKYPGRVTITDVKTGEIVYCYQTGDDYETDGTEQFFDFTGETVFAGEADCFYFTTGAKALKPDTEYRLSVTGYYRTENPDMIYSREFVTRTFTTTGSGAVLSYDQATQSSVQISLRTNVDLNKATVYLLTPEQNATFSRDNTGDYVALWEVSDSAIRAGSYSHVFAADADGNPLPSNTPYIVRVITNNNGLVVTSRQELACKTLKKLPVWNGVPTGSYFRQSNVFGVTRPVVIDEDKGAVRYTYTAYTQQGAETVVAATRTISASEAEPVEFTLDTGKTYTFGVTMEFFDNDKTAFYDLGVSSPVEAAGHTMPSLNISGTRTYNSYTGAKIDIFLHEDSRLVIDGQHKLYLQIYADGVLNEKVELSAPNTPATISQGNITLHEANPATPYQRTIGLELGNLYRNTGYTITLTGSIDLHDGNGLQQMSLGTVSFRSLDMLPLSATWSTTNNTSAVMSRLLKISALEDTSTNTVSQLEHTITQLKTGRIRIGLYSGIGKDKIYLATAYLSGNDLQAVYGAGLDLTEKHFNSPALQANSNYTLVIEEVRDGTQTLYEMNEISYYNDFVPISNDTEPVSSRPTPPDLLEDPSDGITATPIRYAQAGNYGVASNYSDDLPDDTIIGYSVAANYDNSQEITSTITYYAFEYRTYATALAQGFDPIKDAETQNDILLKVELGANTSTKTPKIAVFFGGAAARGSHQNGEEQNGHFLYWPEKSPEDGSDNSAFSRGYRYVFAYTTKYGINTSGNATGGTSSTSYYEYPYQHEGYNDHMNAYGGLTLNGTPIGTGVAYVLNSGVVDAPRVSPSFYSYVETSGRDDAGQLGLTLRYAWIDPEGMIKTQGQEITKLYIDGAGQDINAVDADVGEAITSGDLTWYAARIPYASGQGLLTPEVDVQLYEKSKGYTAFTADLQDGVLNSTTIGSGADSARLIMAKIPVESHYTASSFDEVTSSAPEVTFRLDTSTEKLNYLRVVLDGTSTNVRQVVSRGAALRVTFTEVDTAKSEDDLIQKSFTLPISQNTMECYAHIGLGMLSDFENKSYRITNVQMLYDTGLQGWEFAGKNNTGFYTLQEYDEENGILGAYAGARTASNDTFPIPSNEAAWKPSGSFTADTLTTLLTGEDSTRLPEGSKYPLNSDSALNSGHISRYLFPSALGIDLSTSASLENLSGVAGVPKKLAMLTIQPKGGVYPEDELDAMTPNITGGNAGPVFSPSISSITISDFKVSGLGDLEKKIYVAGYTGDTAAADAEQMKSNASIPETAIQLDENGEPLAPVQFTNLSENTNYYFAFYYKKTTGTTTEKILLLKQETGKVAVYGPIATIDGVAITVDTPEYVNTHYFFKRLTMNFSMSNTYRIYMKYDIYDADGENLIMSYLDTNPNGNNHLVYIDPTVANFDPETAQPNAKGILHVPYTLTKEVNTITLDLNPSLNRQKLVPGVTYTMRFTAYEVGTNLQAGTADKQFTITGIGHNNAHITVSNVTSEDGIPSITYRATINDGQKSYMGAGSFTYSKDFGGLYAVRFTDSAGKRIRTKYDDKVYSTYQLDNQMKVFNLRKNMLLTSDDTLTFGETYTMHVFAAEDSFHIGQFTLNGTTYKWSDFFNSKDGDKAPESRETWGAKFNAVIDSFWEPGNLAAKTDEATLALRERLTIGTKSQITGDADGYLLDTDGILAKRTVDGFRITFADSFNLLDRNGVPVFNRITINIDGTDADTGEYGGGYIDMVRSQTQALIQLGEDGVYYLDVPVSVKNCSIYYITMQFRESVDAVEADLTHSFRSNG